MIAKDNFLAFKAANYPSLSEDDAFERFAVSEVSLRSNKLGGAMVEDGLVGAKDDGGIDGFFVLLNGQELVQSDSARLTKRRNALDGLQTGLSLEVVIVQAKNETSWDTNVFPKIESALKAILAADVSASTLRSFPLNDDVVEKALMLRKLREKLSPLVPVMKFTVEYVTFAPESGIDKYMETKRQQLESWLLTKLPSGSSTEVSYVGDSSVVTQLRKSHDFFAKLVFAKAPVRVGKALVGLVKIEDYIAFLRQEGAAVIREELFAVNVRDYAGASIGVNNAIAKTLANDSQSEFWWLNNGNTIIADAASDPIELEWMATNPMIVNGLQTSHVIQAESIAGNITKTRLEQTVLVRLIIESDPVVRESIIAGTNNQTAIASTQLHANEEKQIRIEEYLRHESWYYERRRYQYRGASTPAGRVRTVTDVAQAVMSYRLLEPDTARARPGSLLGTSKGWKRVFNEDESEHLFLQAVETAAAVDSYLKTTEAKAIADDATNARHYLVAGYALRSSGTKNLADFSSVPSRSLKSKPTPADLKPLQVLLYEKVSELDDGQTARDQIFKGPKLKASFFHEILKLNAKK